MSTLSTVFADPSSALLAQEGILDWFNQKNSEVQGAGKGVGLTLAIFVGLFIPIVRKFTIGSIFLGLLVGGLILFAVNNTDFLQDKIENETTTAAAAAAAVVAAPSVLDGIGDTAA